MPSDYKVMNRNYMRTSHPTASQNPIKSMMGVNAFLMGVMMTAQIHEILILNGKKTSMAFCPPLPRDQRVVEYKEDEIEHDSMIFSTACWRQYEGTWDIRDDRWTTRTLKLESI